MHSGRTNKVGDAPGGGDVRTSGEDVVFCLDEICQATGLKLRGEDLPYAPNAAEVDFRPPPGEVRNAIANASRRSESVTRFSRFGACSGCSDQLERSRSLIPDRRLGEVEALI